MSDQNLEKKFLVPLLRDVNAGAVAKSRGVTDEFFNWDTARDLGKLAIWYTETYGSLLTTTALEGALKQATKLSDDAKNSIMGLFVELQLENYDTDINFLIDQLTTDYKHKLIDQAIRRASAKVGEKNDAEAILKLKYDIAEIESRFRVEVARSGQLDTFASRIHFEFDDRKANPKKYEGLKLGFGDMDKITGGLVKSGVALVMAPPKGYKSALAMNICYNAAKRGVYSYYHANEGTVELFYMRYAAMELCIPLTNIYSHTMSPLEESRWTSWIQSVEAGQHQILNKIYFDEVPPAISTPELIGERLKKLKDEGKEVGFVVVDHFGRLTTTAKEAMQDWQLKGFIAQQICSLALEHRIPFMLLTHVSTKSAKEGLETNDDFDAYDIERSGQPLKDVDYVFSWKIQDAADFDRNGKKGFGNLALVLSRHSETGTAMLQVNGKFMQIQEMQIGGTSSSTPITPII